jgi:SAM-dependent methyltransferase
MYALSCEIFGRAIPLCDFPRFPGVRGLGISDSADYATLLGEKVNYINTWYHREPHFDLTDIPESERGRYDFVIASEVLEHVAPPVDQAFRNLFRILKPNGFLLVTVPYTLAGTTTEHFPKLQDYALARLSDSLVLVNRTLGGKLELHENLLFHGGQGSTLELRVFCEKDLRRHVKIAGFREVRFYSEDAPEWGIAHTGWSLPFSARKDQFTLALSTTSDWAEQWESALTAIRTHRAEAAAAKERIASLEAEVQARTEWALSIEKQFQERTAWATSLDRELNEHVEIATRFQKEAGELRDQLARANAELAELRHSRAVRLGRRLGLS